MFKRLTIILAIITAIILFTRPAIAAPRAQATIPDFILNSQTVISVTVAITDGQVIVVPIDLTFIAQNKQGQTDVSVIAEVEQQAGIFIGVAPSRTNSTTLQLPQSAASNTSPAVTNQTPVQTNQPGTYVVNRNANLRAGPGTNFNIVGRAAAGTTVMIVGENEDGSWYQLDDDNWIAAFLVNFTEPEANSNDNSSDDNNSNNISNNESEESISEPVAADATNAVPTLPPALADQTALATYLLDIATIGAQATDVVDTLTSSVENPQPFDPAWRNNVGTQLETLSGVLDQYLALTPVPGYENLHTQVTNVAFTCEQAVDYLVGGLENPLSIDPTLADQSVQACAAQAADLASNIQTLQ